MSYFEISDDKMRKILIGNVPLKLLMKSASVILRFTLGL